MRTNNLKLIFILLAVSFFTGFLPSTSHTEFNIILDEHFNRDRERYLTRGSTPGEYNWYHNVRNWEIDNPRVMTPHTDCGWGSQDLVYNSYILQDEEFPGSLWCAYRTRNGMVNPQWPDADEYWNNTNGWAVWGPFSLEEAVSGYVSFWVIVYLDRRCGDSLSVVIVNTADDLLLDGAAFRSRCGIGKTFPIGMGEDWQQDSVYFDSLYVNGELTSYLGEEECWLCFVWQSDGRYIAGTGAFIDDVECHVDIDEDQAPDVSNNEVSDFRITSTHPNPFNRSVTIGYVLPADSRIRLSVFDISGKQVAVLLNNFVSSGHHSYTWQPSSIPGGIYLLRLEAEGMVHQRKVVYIP